jgi:membrane-associated phospholipid phosphatase
MQEANEMATICKDADDPSADVSWPVQLGIWLGVTTGLVVVAYFLVDQPVMGFVSSCQLGRRCGFVLKLLTRPPEVFVLLSPVVLLVGVIRRWFRGWSRVETVAVAAAVSTLCTALAALLLKITFGRGSDGFHPFHFGAAFWAFPSGHTACTVSVTAVARVAAPRWWLLWWAVPATVAAALIALNHHFVGDIFGGAFVGWAIGGTTARLFGITTSVPDTGGVRA